MIAYLRDYDGAPLKLMEVCGTHTAAIFQSGIRSLLSERIRLVSGPGCPVCVTPAGYVDACVDLARRPGRTVLCFGDMMKVPGSRMNLSAAGSAGASVRVIYSPFEALALAEERPDEEFIVTAVGFETTAPAYALLVEEARTRGMANVKLLLALKSAVSAIDWVCATGEAVDGFLCPGHVSVITGSRVFETLARRYDKPCAVAGFAAGQLVEALYWLAAVAREAKALSTASLKPAGDASRAARDGRFAGEDGDSPGALAVNLYPQAVTPEGNAKALALIERVFERKDAYWRGLGTIPASGFELREEYRQYDVCSYIDDRRYAQDLQGDSGSEACRCGEVILGRIDPVDCPLFAAACTPVSAVGPCMVSQEGACGIWYRAQGANAG